MRFTVTWDPRALDELARIWNRVPYRQAVADAADEMDLRLRDKPLVAGEAWGPDRRLYIAPLEIVYSVSPDDCLVRVLQVVYLGTAKTSDLDDLPL